MVGGCGGALALTMLVVPEAQAARTVKITWATVTEGDGREVVARPRAVLSSSTDRAVVVSYRTVDKTAQAPGDYVARAGTVRIPAGKRSARIPVRVKGDTNAEGTEAFALKITSVRGASAGRSGGVRITDDDEPSGDEPSLLVEDLDVDEGGVASVAVRLSEASSRTVTAQYSTTYGSAGSRDLIAAAGQVTFPPGQTVQWVPVTTSQDSLDEWPEQFTLDLAAPSGAVIGDGSADVTINDDDAEPSVRVLPASVGEGGTATMTAELSAPSDKVVEVNMSVVPGSASFDDVPPQQPSVWFEPGQTSGTFELETHQDALDEVNETMRVIPGPINATAGSEGVLTITDDDAPPRLLVNNQNLVEEGAVNGRVTVRLSEVSGREVRVNWATGPSGTASSEDIAPQSGTVVIPAGQTSAQFSVATTADEVDEVDEEAVLTFSSPQGLDPALPTSGRIVIDDNDSPEIIVFGGNSHPPGHIIDEGDSTRTSEMTVGVMGDPSPQPMTVRWTTGPAASGSASPADYRIESGTVTIPAGARYAGFDVTTHGDLVTEPDESFLVTISDPVDTRIQPGRGAEEVVIRNDDCTEPDEGYDAAWLAGTVIGDAPPSSMNANGEICRGGDVDWFKFKLRETQSGWNAIHKTFDFYLWTNTQQSRGGARVELWDSSRTRRIAAENAAPTGGTSEPTSVSWAIPTTSRSPGSTPWRTPTSGSA